MRVRHRIPSLFNLSMVDVLCCALGCVILLWLVNLRDARSRAEAAGQTSRLLAATQANLDETARAAAETSSRLAALEEQARVADELARKLRAERDRGRQELEATRTQLAQLDRQMGTSTARLAKLDQEKAVALRRVTELELLTREKDKLANTAGRRADELTDKLLALEKRAKQLMPLADLVPGLRRQVQEYQDKLTASERRMNALENELSTAGQRITSLQGERTALTEQVVRARAAAENRFAGIELTGRRVVFLVDVSGSMQYLDAETAAPAKWPAVRDTVARVLRSLPDLEKFQLILFSDKVQFPLGREGQWLTYDPKTSGDFVTKALAAITPKGNTNMYAAFEAAFKYRAEGMDTVYVFSDGLPNLGEGLPAAPAKPLGETERATLLGKHVRTKLRSAWNAAKPSQPRVRINAVGFFYDSPDLGAFLWALTRENEGSFVGMSKP